MRPVRRPVSGRDDARTNHFCRLVDDFDVVVRETLRRRCSDLQTLRDQAPIPPMGWFLGSLDFGGDPLIHHRSIDHAPRSSIGPTMDHDDHRFDLPFAAVRSESNFPTNIFIDRVREFGGL